MMNYVIICSGARYLVEAVKASGILFLYLYHVVMLLKETEEEVVDAGPLEKKNPDIIESAKPNNKSPAMNHKPHKYVC